MTKKNFYLSIIYMDWKRKGSKKVRSGKRSRRSRSTRANKWRLARSTNVRNQIYYFKRYANNPGSWTGNIAYNPLCQGNSFSLGQVVNPSDFTTLFDQYCITCIVVRFFLKIDPSAQTASTASYPRLYYVRDYDDATAPASLNEMREHAHVKVKVLNPNRGVTIKFRPSTLNLVYRTAVASSYSPHWKQWVDMANTDIPHYGLKWVVDDLTNTNYKLETETLLYFKCRGVR